MRKQVQKERCTKIMLTKCKAVCHLYDKVQLAAAKMLDAEPAIFQFECNVPILCNDIPANDLNLPSETYTTDFVLHYDDRDGSVYHAVLDSALRSRGWRSLTGGRTYATKIETALLNLYGSYIPTADLSTKQLHATLCSKSVAPRYVLQLAVLLGLSLHDLLHAPDAVPDYKAEMKAMYQSGASMYHIAQLYGIDAKTVARWIKS